MILILVWIFVLITAVTVYLRQVYSKFEVNGVKNRKPFPLLGNMGPILLRRVHIGNDVLDWYRAFPDQKFVGNFEFLKEVLMIRDLELVKKITVKDFEHFLDHRTLFREDGNSYFTRSLIALKGQEWKDMRSTLSPAFTSSKIRLMVPFMREVGDQMMATIKNKIESSHAGYIDIDCKDLTTRYANDVIASCVFGLKVDSHTDVDNEFYTMGKKSLNIGVRELFVSIFLLILPKINKLLKMDIMTSESKEFFKTLVLGTMKDRELRNIVRPDMIHLLMQAKKGNLSHDNVKSNDTTGFATVEESSVGMKKVNRVWTDNDLIAQALLFFLAGFETVSTAMSFLLHEIAVNTEVQDKLAQEIKDHDIKNDGKFDLKSIQDMPYLDMVVSESIRMWPPAMTTERLCNKDYNLGKPNSEAVKDYIIRTGTSVVIPIFAFHRDPQYFPNPDKFDPERFSDENKHNIHPFAYMPFGAGPRNCIGSRFALCEMKILIYQILRLLEVSPSEKTCIPSELANSFKVELKGGHWLRFKART